jgi:hypothetical protein
MGLRTLPPSPITLPLSPIVLACSMSRPCDVPVPEPGEEYGLLLSVQTRPVAIGSRLVTEAKSRRYFRRAMAESLGRASVTTTMAYAQ